MMNYLMIGSVFSTQPSYSDQMRAGLTAVVTPWACLSPSASGRVSNV